MSKASHWFRKVFKGTKKHPAAIVESLATGFATVGSGAVEFSRGIQTVIKKTK